LEVSGQLHIRAALPPVKEPRYPLDRKLVGPETGQDDVEKRKILTLLGLVNPDPSVIQPVASRYTNYAIPAPRLLYRGVKFDLFMLREEQN
jgi:hypothetical protein